MYICTLTNKNNQLDSCMLMTGNIEGNTRDWNIDFFIREVEFLCCVICAYTLKICMRIYTIDEPNASVIPVLWFSPETGIK